MVIQDLIYNKKSLDTFSEFVPVFELCEHNTYLSSLDSTAILSLSSIVNCLCLVNRSMSPSLLAPTRSKVWLDQMLKMSPSRTNTCFSPPSDLSLHITQSALAYLRWSCVNLCNELFLACYLRFFMQPQRKTSNGVRFGDLAGQATGLPLPVIYLENGDVTIGILEVWNVLEHCLVGAIDVSWL